MIRYIVKIKLIVFTVFFSACVAEKKESLVIADGAQLELIDDFFAFTEGPAVDMVGNVFFTDQPNDQIWKWSAESGEISVFMEGCGRSNGLYFDKEGYLWACADENNQLWKIDQNKGVQVMLKDYQEVLFNGPNDLWIDDEGGVYFTDPFYLRPYWKREAVSMINQAVYYLGKDGSLNTVETGLKKPNGIVGSPDGQSLFIADIGDNKTYKYTIHSTGALSDRKLFAPMGSDGMTIDRSGNLYLTGKGVSVFDSMGNLIEHIAVDAPWTANVAFGGSSKNLLFITASNAVYTLKMKVKGN
jgi:gluconolactonase|tara:strand:- start:2290 stop:3189 length:900 start_codon:yes stop_codon:yes gene_type:complete